MASQDTLAKYKAKRNFSITPEPAGGGKRADHALTFVVQKHWASRLHYDFRLELDGTMKSWAVPKGPSYDPRDKRMAVHVEDHPISYSSFEGTIPAKQYGAGKVIIWDSGTWTSVGDAHQGYHDGDLKFELHGHKLNGKWVLVRMKPNSAKPPAWLLIKEKDDHARPSSEFSVVDQLPDSVAGAGKASGKKSTADQVASPPSKVPSVKANSKTKINSGKPHEAALRSALPAKLSPQLATLVDGLPANREDWIYEIKFDGYRLLTRVEGADIRLMTRNGNDWTSRMPALKAAIKKSQLPPGWYDGEIVVLNEQGVPDFGALQNAFDSASTRDIVYYLFDAPYINGFDMREVPLEARRATLESALAKADPDVIRFSQVFDAAPASMVASACKLGLEGIIAKRRNASYQSARSNDWIKLKCSQRQEFVIGGWTDPKGGRAAFGSLLLGVHDKAGKLVYAGNVGTGFNEKTLHDIRSRLDSMEAEASAFVSTKGITGKPHWVKPELVAEVTFGEWTSAGHIRHSVFHGLRCDKPASSIIREKAASVPKAVKASTTATAKEKPVASKEPSHALPSRLRITHPERVIDKSTGITKLELMRYYALVGDLMMVHLKGRPVSLVRAPAGIGGQLFFQKHAETEKLEGIRQLDPALYVSHPPLLEVTNKDGLLSAAQWNIVEIHTMNTGTKSLLHPDRIVFDLDPGAGVAWESIQQAASVIHLFLKELGLTSFLKTSGGKGLHVVVPLKTVHDWDTAKGFSRAVVEHLSRTLPKMFVAKSGPSNRAGKIFIDYLRNGLGATTVCAWSARARPGLGISVPVEWSELPSLHGGDHWTIRSAHTRLDKGNEPWKGYVRAAKSLTGAMKLLGYKSPS